MKQQKNLLGEFVPRIWTVQNMTAPRLVHAVGFLRRPTSKDRLPALHAAGSCGSVYEDSVRRLFAAGNLMGQRLRLYHRPIHDLTCTRCRNCQKKLEGSFKFFASFLPETLRAEFLSLELTFEAAPIVTDWLADRSPEFVALFRAVTHQAERREVSQLFPPVEPRQPTLVDLGRRGSLPNTSGQILNPPWG